MTLHLTHRRHHALRLARTTHDFIFYLAPAGHGNILHLAHATHESILHLAHARHDHILHVAHARRHNILHLVHASMAFIVVTTLKKLVMKASKKIVNSTSTLRASDFAHDATRGPFWLLDIVHWDTSTSLWVLFFPLIWGWVILDWFVSESFRPRVKKHWKITV